MVLTTLLARSSKPPPSPEIFITEYGINISFTVNVSMAATALVVYDSVITFDLLVYFGEPERVSCERAGNLWLAASALVQLVKTAFFLIRTWAIWGHHWLPVAILLPLGTAVMSMNIVANGNMKLVQIQSPSTLMKTLGIHRLAKQAGINAKLTTLLIRDGSIFAGVILIFNVIIIVFLFLDRNGSNVLGSAQPMIGSILLSRLVLNLRSLEVADNSSQTSTLQFAGNIGAPLQFSSNNSARADEDDLPAARVSTRQISNNPLTIGLFEDRGEEGRLLATDSDTEKGKDSGATTTSNYQVNSADQTSPMSPNAPGPSTQVYSV
ncbi:hypothetical protein C8Q75DRAFT_736568 [Abortiporus biennis]|nr:hypothetical protein C8Q75DRAFT_736568 [Abortiporus biennis]